MRLRTTTLLLGLVAMLGAPCRALAQPPPPASQPAPSPTRQPGEVLTGGPAPRLELSTEEWNFGFKWHGEPCSTEIVISNTGEATLKIIKVKSSCGCTVAKPGKRELLPGESDSMTLSYNTKKKKKQVSQTITLVTNDPERPRVAIKITGEVKEVYEAKPASRITFVRVDRDAAMTESIELHNNMEEEVILKLQPFSEPLPFEVELEEVEHGRVYKLSATTKPPLKVGANSANIVLETGVEQFPSLTIPVSAYIAPRVVVRPATLFVSAQLTRSFQRIVSVDFRPENPIKITEIRSSHPDLITAELLPSPQRTNPQAPLRRHQIRVTLPPGDQLPEGGGSLEIYTDDPSPEYQKLVVKVELRRTAARPARSKQGKVAAEVPE